VRTGRAASLANSVVFLPTRAIVRPLNPSVASFARNEARRTPPDGL
jgi:hypothetical protein